MRPKEVMDVMLSKNVMDFFNMVIEYKHSFWTDYYLFIIKLKPSY